MSGAQQLLGPPQSRLGLGEGKESPGLGQEWPLGFLSCRPGYGAGNSQVRVG